MRIAIYGLPCAGKTTLMNSIGNAKIISGSNVLNSLANGCFNSLTAEEKKNVRIKYTEYINSLNDDLIVSDGHYSFLDDVVFTCEDGDLYDTFFYLYCDPKVLHSRMAKSEKNFQYSSLSFDVIKRWQEFEISSLREECHIRNKDFYVISDNDFESAFIDFLNQVKKGLSAVSSAKEIVDFVLKRYPTPRTIYVVDGDKTLIEQDSFRYCYEEKTNVFDGNFYTGYQSYLFEKELQSKKLKLKNIDGLTINKDVWDVVDKNNYIILSSGITEIWKLISEKFSISNVIANIMISADTKYYVVKFLEDLGYKIIAIGDSKMDLYMLRKADIGKLYIGKRLSKSLKNEIIDRLDLIYDKSPVFLSDEDEMISSDVKICKSDSGINGNLLASAHFRLGQKIGEKLATIFPAPNTALLILERGGRFFGDGVYCSFGGVLYPYNPSKDKLPLIKHNRIIIIDSVINTGKSIFKLITEIKHNNPSAEIVVVSNVIQEKAVSLFSSYKVIAIRHSLNSFVGKNQPKQIGKTGPDTADRLFNLIDGCIF